MNERTFIIKQSQRLSRYANALLLPGFVGVFGKKGQPLGSARDHAPGFGVPSSTTGAGLQVTTAVWADHLRIAVIIRGCSAANAHHTQRANHCASSRQSRTSNALDRPTYHKSAYALIPSSSVHLHHRNACGTHPFGLEIDANTSRSGGVKALRATAPQQHKQRKLPSCRRLQRVATSTVQPDLV